MRWPSSERVAGQARFDPTLPQYGQHVVFTPAQPLEVGDYALHLRPAPAHTFEHPPAPDGFSRFYVGNRPDVVSLQLCEKADAHTKLLVSFSEAVQQTGGTVRVFDGDTPVPCEAPVIYAEGLELLCAYRPSTTTRVRLEGFQSTSGVRLATQEIRVEPVPVNDGCASWPSR